ncbi:MAG: hypothetical protein P8188_03385 [Gemmatimonadota bacterium]
MSRPLAAQGRPGPVWLVVALLALSTPVDFRITARRLSPTTAHETGIFRYRAEPTGPNPEGAAASDALVHFEALLVRKDGRWVMLMEYQRSEATPAEWEEAAGG